MLRGSRPCRRRGVDVSVLVAVTGAGGKADLSATKIEAVDGKTPAEIAAELDRRAQDIRAHRDDGLRRARRTLSFVPTWLMGLVLRFMTFLSYTLNLDLRRFGVPRDPFGAAVVTASARWGGAPSSAGRVQRRADDRGGRGHRRTGRRGRQRWSPAGDAHRRHVRYRIIDGSHAP